MSPPELAVGLVDQMPPPAACVVEDGRVAYFYVTPFWWGCAVAVNQFEWVLRVAFGAHVVRPQA